MHGTVGFLQTDRLERIILIVFACIGLVVLALAIAGLLNKTIARRLKVLLLSVSVFLAVISIAGFVYLSPLTGIGDTSPQLLVTDTVGSHGIPNLAVTFDTAQKTTGTLQWGKASPGSALTEQAAVRQHYFNLVNLEPGTDYWYRVNGGETYSFTTPDATGSPVRFAVGSDMHYGAADSDPAAKLKMLGIIASPSNDYDLFLSLGDMVEFGFNKAHWHDAFNAVSSASSVIPTALCVGNHETLLAGLGPFEKLAYPDGINANSGSKLWHRYDIGNAHFLTIDLEWNAESFTDEQAMWLEEPLKQIPAEDWTMVLGHCYYYASGSMQNGWPWYDNKETIARLSPLFEKYGVDLVFSGHVHQMEFLQKNGVSYVVCGTFGGIPDAGRTYTSPASLWYLVGENGFADVTLNGDEATIVFRDPDNGVWYQTKVQKNTPGQ